MPLLNRFLKMIIKNKLSLHGLRVLPHFELNRLLLLFFLEFTDHLFFSVYEKMHS